MAYEDHGHTPAAWTAVIMIVAGFLVAGIGVIMLSWQVFWFGGIGLIVLGGIAGKVMQMMGMGKASREQTPDQAAEQMATTAAEGRSG
ncbi:HGxxPAAW family protein [Phytoactinopolyspora mesophila]|uniref:Uncharacterized protein n=1 Tax=Phytoactinopolyspora mesophila TaxID=2650750 RepID=A0A7K3LWX0_9ACTN|nr:HGxxPAAW family protein [Phytoactinopolyspora mesophila]NDL55460.1 hypothetical protein [Phytoactinopolyspora mesophila]